MFKSGEERQSARREREAARIREAAAQAQEMRQAEARKRDAPLATPAALASAAATEAAAAAMRAGQMFFEVQLPVGRQSGTAFFGTTTAEHQTTSSAVTLGEIEKIGWHLEHASYYFMVTGESSTDRVLRTGEKTAITGMTIGVYLFRNTEPR